MSDRASAALFAVDEDADGSKEHSRLELQMVQDVIWHRIGGVSGLVAVALVGAHFRLADPYDPASDPNPTQPSTLLAQALIDNRDDARLSAYLGLAGVFALILFLAFLHNHLVRAEDGRGWLATATLGGGLLVAGLTLLSVNFSFAGSELASYGDDTAVAKSYFVFGWNAASAFAPAVGAILFAVTAAGFRYSAFPGPFNWLSLVFAVLILSVSTVAPGLAATIGLVWLGAVSLVLLLPLQRT